MKIIQLDMVSVISYNRDVLNENPLTLRKPIEACGTMRGNRSPLKVVAFFLEIGYTLIEWYREIIHCAALQRTEYP